MLGRRMLALWTVVLALVLGVGMLASACGDDDDADSGVATAQADEADDHEDEDQAESHEDQAEEQDELDADAARTITVDMSDFAFTPDVIEVQRDELVRLVLQNTGSVLHDMTMTDFVGHAEAPMSAMHDDSAAHDEGEELAFHAAAETGDEVELIFRAEEAGTFELFCSVPGHRELGMVASLVVTG